MGSIASRHASLQHRRSDRRSKADLARAVWLRIASSFVPGIFQMIGSDISLDEKIAEALGLGPKELRAFMKRRRAELPALRKRTL